jgi:heme-degrading monooxygenase HmoA
MNRRTYLQTIATLASTAVASAAADGVIQLHVEMEVDPAHEKELLASYRETFRPAISKQPGFVDAKLMKFRSVTSGGVKPPASYRLLICFQNEELRLKWVATDLHQKVWQTLSKTLKNPDAVAAILYDLV